MAVTVVFLGKMADLAGAPEKELDAPLDWQGLLAALPDEAAREASGERTRIAVNGQLVSDKASLAAGDGDEIALLPPVSGG